jgi:putative spermidine/putrescine transport system ATP-binding protein
MEVHGDRDFIVKVPNSAGHQPLQVNSTTRIGWAAEDCRALDA